jgi:hypothetical protein
MTKILGFYGFLSAFEEELGNWLRITLGEAVGFSTKFMK